MNEERLGDLLSRLEDLELPLLAWGVVDGFLSEDDVIKAIDEQRIAEFAAGSTEVPAAEEYLEVLVDRGLLFRQPTGDPRYRTRFAETLRLLRLLRQLWPPKDTNADGWWRAYAPLVADYRLRVSPRRYPKRELDADQVAGVLQASLNWGTEQDAMLRRLVGASKLAPFQLRATASVLAAVAAERPTARIVTAGTGSGKTLAFYLPALLDLAAGGGRRRGPHTLALYPRIELLRDQAREAMLVGERAGLIVAQTPRPLRIALLYGSTPRVADFQRGTVRGWSRNPAGWVSPFFPCLEDNCVGDQVWLDSDRTSAIERLTCATCGRTTADGALAITRESIVSLPPDILFSTTEMLSKQATSSKLGPLLGWKGPIGIRLVLLDEAHTYAGVHGAQVAYTLRRWRHALRQWGPDSPVVVGLSATLRDAGQFFSTLTGVDRGDVEVIAPASNELAPISRDYGVVLRGDPLSGAALLSTTIQALMLVGRMMDRTPHIFGSVAFAFTDDLDVINRLYDNLRDAEGASNVGRSRGQVLGSLRDPGLPHAGKRYDDGQSWDLANRLGRMTGPLRVARTSSQDSGVDGSADVVVATSSLEVGFNDPRVGVVLQHKAPRDMASFLQRRGRAGRRLDMRPLTLVVLSDYGRDRAAYQSYEQLLEPELRARAIPVGNRFVVKIQAAHALLDWIARVGSVDARAFASPPWSSQVPNPSRVVNLLRDLLNSASRQDELKLHVQRALAISPDEADAALWEEPRSLLLSVVPTLLRRLENGWQALPGQSDAGAVAGQPLPEFLTATLFDSLNTPDVILAMPPDFRSGEPQTMAIGQAMREAVPGRVSRRFGHAHASHRTWLPIPDAGDVLELRAVVSKGHALGEWTDTSGENFIVVRPLELQLASPPRDVADTSSARPVWRSDFSFAQGSLQDMDVPTPSAWAGFISQFAFALHVSGSPVTVRRFCVGADGELVTQDNRGLGRTPLTVRYAHEGKPAALGFELEADALIVEGLVPDSRDREGLSESPAWRTLCFRRRVLEDTTLDGIANHFQRRWLVEVYLYAYAQLRLRGSSAEDATDALRGGTWATDLAAFLASAYRSDDPALVSNQRILSDLEHLSSEADVRAAIEGHASLLTNSDLAQETGDLWRRAFADTLAAALLDATFETVPDAQESDLVADVVFDSNNRGRFRVIVSETSVGGLGVMEALSRSYAVDPRRFWEAVGRAVGSSDAEETDRSMRIALGELDDSSSQFATAVGEFRAATDSGSLDIAFSELRDAWIQFDGPPTHLALSTFAARLLRPGARPQIDRRVSWLATRWLDVEAEINIEIDARTLAYFGTSGALGEPIAPLNLDSAFSMLWPRGYEARNQRLQYWQPFRDDVLIERLVLDDVVRDRAVAIDVTGGDWIQKYKTALSADGRVRLTAPDAARAGLAVAIRTCLATPIERSGLRVYPRLEGVDRRFGLWNARMAFVEELQ
ncbi:DEAD/DEAH box helicase domain protein [Nocardioides sp. PD653]|nr:DEAD/DEAH box helicase domain protein [Nocardioides sp. PD653-B2]GAW55744.1 DEAD/DEAH box helicase domain protein [Nocardioides sp. PD653]